MVYSNKNSATLDDNQQEMLDSMCKEASMKKTDMFRELVKTAHEAGGIDNLKVAVKQLDAGDTFDYDYNDYSGLLSREWLTNGYEPGTPINPDHVDSSQLPKKSGDTAAVLHGMAIFMGVTNTELESPDESSEILELIWEYVGLSDHIEDTYCNLIAKIHGIHNEKATFNKSIIKYYGKSEEELETIIEHVEGPQKRAAKELLKGGNE